MDQDISTKISTEWEIDQETIERYLSSYSDTIRSAVKTKYLSHLVTTVENMVNDKRKKDALKSIEKKEGQVIRSLFASNTFRLYSIVLVPINLKRRATTRHHPSGAIIFYNSSYEEKTIRILIAHELGHIVNRELVEDTKDSEQTANLFAYIAMHDKNHFYVEECKRFISHSDIEILNDIISSCPVPGAVKNFSF